MKKVILQFNSLSDVAAFAKTLDCGYVIDTRALTLTGTFNPAEIAAVQQAYNVLLLSGDLKRPDAGVAERAYTLQSFV